MDDRIKNIIDSFAMKLEKVYAEGMIYRPDQFNEASREIAGTNINLYDFWGKYCESKYYRDDIELNLKIISALQDVIIEGFFILNCELSAPVNTFGVVYSQLVQLNREQSLIIKVRIYWERIMNFCYLLIEGKELSIKNSKKKKFKDWAHEHGFVFLEDALLLVEDYDNAFRTPEVHKFSRIRSAIVKDEPFSVFVYAITMLKFGYNIYPNLLIVLNGKTNYIRQWVKVDGQLTAFSKVPEWAKEMARNNGFELNENAPVFLGQERQP